MSKPKKRQIQGGKIDELRSSVKMLEGCLKKRDYFFDQLIKSKPGQKHKEGRKSIRNSLSNENRRFREIIRKLNDDMDAVQDDYAGNTKELLTTLSKEQEVNRTLRESDEIARTMRGSLASLEVDRLRDKYEFDFFISHASEDKDEIARPLSNILIDFGYRVWFDEFTLEIGDSLREKITRGLARTRFGIVVLSSDFFKKRWPISELNGLFQRAIDNPGIILPLLHHLSIDEVRRADPVIADIVMLNTSALSLVDIAAKLDQRFKAARD